jgi:hypothetical protein
MVNKCVFDTLTKEEKEELFRFVNSVPFSSEALVIAAKELMRFGAIEKPLTMKQRIKMSIKSKWRAYLISKSQRLSKRVVYLRYIAAYK